MADKLKLPQKIENNILSKFFDLEALGNIANSTPIIPGANTVGGILLAVNYAKQEQFLIDVVNDRLTISDKEVNKEAFLKRFYLTSQVITKAQTQEKYNRFKKLLINSTIYEISDDNYEMYNRLIDELTDKEFLFLAILTENIDKKLNFSDTAGSFKKLEEQYENATKKAQEQLNISDIHIYRNILVGKGLISSDNTIDSLYFKNLPQVTYDLIDFIKKEGVADE